MKKEGGCEWYQSMGHIFLYISAIFLLFFKGPRPFKQQKTLFSGLTTQNAPRLNQGTYAAKKHDSGWDIAWIFHAVFLSIFVDFLQQNLHSYYHCKDWNWWIFSTYNSQIQCLTGAQRGWNIKRQL